MSGAYKYRPQYTQNTIGPDKGENMSDNNTETEHVHVPDFKIHIGKTILPDGSKRVRIRFDEHILQVAILPEQAIAIAEDIIKKAREILG